MNETFTFEEGNEGYWRKEILIPNIKQVIVYNSVLLDGIYLIDKNDKDYEYTQPLMESIHDYIWDYEQDLGRETTDEEWVECRNGWLEHFCISNGIKSLRVESEELLKQ